MSESAQNLKKDLTWVDEAQAVADRTGRDLLEALNDPDFKRGLKVGGGIAVGGGIIYLIFKILLMPFGILFD